MNERLLKEIEDAHQDYLEINNREPDYAMVKIKWNEDGTTGLEIIAFDSGKDAVSDDAVLYWCSSVAVLKALTAPNNCSDFVVVDFYGFN